MRTLNKVAMTQPMSVTTCNLDLENLITDVNRSIATLAITTLLKVCFFTCIVFICPSICEQPAGLLQILGVREFFYQVTEIQNSIHTLKSLKRVKDFLWLALGFSEELHCWEGLFLR